ncbi:hypothetical protein [Lapidilactobacillus dextrinicus]|uniref:hypothetical protein n=1 Tax=Lapidilactobacillus dextrinicus TaxID=51664 RepID=UPI003F20F00B
MLSIDYLNKLIKWLTNRIVAIKVVPRIGVLEIAAVFFIFYEVNDFFVTPKNMFFVLTINTLVEHCGHYFEPIKDCFKARP